MPKSPLDWLAITTLWLGAGILAIKSGDLPLMVGAPSFFAHSIWSSAPFVLVSAAGAMMLYRAIAPSNSNALTPILPEPPVVHPEPPVAEVVTSVVMVPPRLFITPETTPQKLLALGVEHMGTQAKRLRAPYIGKWMKVCGRIWDINTFDGFISVSFQNATASGSAPEVRLYFEKDWEERLETHNRGDLIYAVGKIEKIDWNVALDKCEIIGIAEAADAIPVPRPPPAKPRPRRPRSPKAPSSTTVD